MPETAASARERLARLALLSLATLLALTLFAPPAPAAKDKGKGKVKAQSLLLREEMPEITPEDLALKEVSYAPGAPAVVLLRAARYEWQDIQMLRVNYFSRVKVLTEAGIEDQGDFTYNLYGDWRIKEVEARTILPDGTEVDASEGIHREASADAGYKTIRVAFPQVQVGAILDLHITFAIDGFSVSPWIIQEEIPVLDSRFILVPPVGLSYNTALFGQEAEKVKPAKVRLAAGKTAYIWRFQDVQPVPDEPNRPALEDVSEKLVIVLNAYRDDVVYIPIASSWKDLSETDGEDVEDWRRTRHGDSDALAKEITAGLTDPLEKAEAIRVALRERVHMEYFSDGFINDSPDEVLEKGNGTSGEIAALAASMLRAAGVEAELGLIRRRSSGTVPAEVPIPALFNDYLVRIPAAGGAVWFSPSADTPAGTLPWDCTGILVLPLGGEVEAPESIPDAAATENRTARRVKAKIDEQGTLTAEATVTYDGLAAESWRRSLQGEEEDEQRAMVERRLGRWMPGAVLGAMEIENLEDATEDLVITCEWEVTGYATRAGSRLLFNPYLFSRAEAEDWAAEERTLGIHLDRAYETIDTVFLELPKEAGEVTLPQPARLDAGPVGLYQTKLDRSGGTLIVKRTMRLDLYKFPPRSYKGLKAWFTDIAQSDDQVIVVSMP